ncbi:MAG: Eco47II family restriction endonuclease [Candidatus Kapaibacteriales bacterium]
MANKYLEYISDEHLLNCIGYLHSSYTKAKEKITRQKFYSNKIDIFKLSFDTRFNDIKAEDAIQNEILRQIDKSINNSIGTFHEKILGGVKGYEIGKLSGFDIKAQDDTLFADIKNKHNTMNSSSAEALFQKLSRYADTYKKSKCYWVQILAKSSFEEPWIGDINGKEYSHSRVFKISGDRFYALITGYESALFDLYKSIPSAIDEYLASNRKDSENLSNSAFSEIKNETIKSNRGIIDQITFDNFVFYLGFDKL